jgi:hypothetical protein
MIFSPRSPRSPRLRVKRIVVRIEPEKQELLAVFSLSYFEHRIVNSELFFALAGLEDRRTSIRDATGQNRIESWYNLFLELSSVNKC